MTSFDEIIGWVTQDGTICPAHKPTTKREETRFERLLEKKKDGQPLTIDEQDFFDEIELRAAPIFDGEVSQHWNEEDHSIRCAEPGCEEQDILEPDEEYSYLYRLLEAHTAAFQVGNHYYCTDCDDRSPAPSRPVTYEVLKERDSAWRQENPEHEPLSCTYCDCPIIEDFEGKLKRFKYDWDHLSFFRTYPQELFQK